MNITAIAVAAVLLLAACTQPQGPRITSFAECVAAGNPVMESYPRQCRTDGKTFVEELPDWKADGVTLRRIPETGSVACFGCGATQCRDPIPALEIVEETAELHCTEDFEVVGTSADAGTPAGKTMNESVIN